MEPCARRAGHRIEANSPVAPPPEQSRGRRPREQPHTARSRERPRGGLPGQVLLVVAAWAVYSLARSLSGEDVVGAIRRGNDFLSWDDRAGFGWVFGVNHWVTAHGIVAVPMSLSYATLHYLVTPLVLVWLWRSHPRDYPAYLTALLAMSAIGLVVYIVLPVAPPRLLPGADLMDTMTAWSHVGWWGNGGSAPAGLEHFTDQYAAMPSLHVGWAVWCAHAWQRLGSGPVRRIAWLYPLAIAIVVVATANHYVIDVVAGLLLAQAACTVVPFLIGHARLTPAGVVPTG